MKQIRLSKHAQEQAIERGASQAEVEQAVRKGSRESATRGREMCRYNCVYNREWQGKHYPIKQVAPIIKEEVAKSLSSPFTHFTFKRGQS
jgi:hypothetical protein